MFKEFWWTKYFKEKEVQLLFDLQVLLKSHSEDACNQVAYLLRVTRFIEEESFCLSYHHSPEDNTKGECYGYIESHNCCFLVWKLFVWDFIGKHIDLNTVINIICLEKIPPIILAIISYCDILIVLIGLFAMLFDFNVCYIWVLAQSESLYLSIVRN